MPVNPFTEDYDFSNVVIQETLSVTNDGHGIPVPSAVDAVTTNGFVYDILWLW